ncbi:MAG: DivIVA domain-containing protein [Gaiellaceae bacterium]
MRYTPVELRHVRIRRTFLGYKRDETDRMLEDIADSFAEVWRERGELTDRLEDVEKHLAELKQREALLASTLISAERAAADAKDAAKREAELIVAEAHSEARSVVRTAQTERARLFAEARRIETLLRTALGMVEESQAATSAPQEPASDPPAEPAAPEPWPKHEDTREFEAPVLPDPPLPPAAATPPALPPVLEADPGSGESPWEDRDFAWG